MKYDLRLVDADTPDKLVEYVKIWLRNECAPSDVVESFLKEVEVSNNDDVVKVCHKYIEIVNDLAYEHGFADISDCIID